MLTAEQLSYLKKKLEENKQNIEHQLSKVAKKDNTVEGNYRTPFPEIGNQIDENAQEITEYEQSLSIEHSLEEELKLVNEALEKMANGKYGFCENCQQEIPYERLAIRPQSVMCIVCKSQKEQEN